MKRILLIVAVTLALVPLLKSSASGSPVSGIGPVVGMDHGLNVDLWSDRNQDEVYYPGESVDIFFRANDDCFVTIYSIGSDGDIEILFPQYPDNGFVFGGMTYRLPEYYDDWNYRISGPTGVEYLQAVASRHPRPFRYGQRNGRYHLGFDPVVGDPFIAINSINSRIILSSRIHATATLSFFIGSRVWYPRYMCYDCHGRSARFDPYSANCPRYTVRLAHDYDYWWAHDYHPAAARFVFGGPFWRFEMRSGPSHRYDNAHYVNCALGHRNYYPVRSISRPPHAATYRSPRITTYRTYQKSRERVTYSETTTHTVQRKDGTRVRTTGNTRTTDRDNIVPTPSSRSRNEVTTVPTPSSRSRSEVTTVPTPSSRSRNEVTTVPTPSSRSRSESTASPAPSSRSRSESTASPAPSSRARSESTASPAPSSRARSESTASPAPSSRARSESTASPTPSSRARSESTASPAPSSRSRSEGSDDDTRSSSRSRSTRAR
ncbi:MAG: DUF4384 domain-containing protein [Bacteroidota bacterium]